jgi:DNA-binding response OmpR family regulator
MSTAAKILIVDDEESIRFSLEDLLGRDGHDVVCVESGESALDEIARQEFDLALLDLKLGGIGGLEVLAALREQSMETAVIVLTAHGSMETAIDALRQGAHDYLLKPCDAASLRESVRTALQKREREQRQRALLLHVEQSSTNSLEEIRAAAVEPLPQENTLPGEVTPAAMQTLQWGGLVVHLGRHMVTLDGHPLELTRTEFDLLAQLARRAPNVVSPQELVMEVQGYDCEGFEAAEIVRHLVHRIRQKARSCAGRTNIIRTVRGVGYALDD